MYQYNETENTITCLEYNRLGFHHHPHSLPDLCHSPHLPVLHLTLPSSDIHLLEQVSDTFYHLTYEGYELAKGRAES